LRLALATVLTTLTACSLFTSLGDLDGETPGGADASPDGATPVGSDGGSDANVVADTGGPIVPGDDASPDAGYANLHPNGSMEFSCQGWYPYNATLESSPTAHGGSASCMVCADKTVQDTATIDEGGAIANPVVGGVYVASGWFRVPDGKLPPSSGVKLVFNTKDGNGGTPEFQQTALMAIDTTWKKLSVQLTVTKPAAKFRIWAGGGAELGHCFLVDDIRVERWQ
jgi:hypothetical protein